MHAQTASVTVNLQSDTMTCQVYGDIDHHSARIIRAQIDNEFYLKRPRRLLLDMSHVEFMDSSGLGLILGRFSKASEIATEFAVLNPSQNVVRILDLAGIGRMITIERTKENHERTKKSNE